MTASLQGRSITSRYRRSAAGAALVAAGLVGTALAQSAGHTQLARVVTPPGQATIPDQYIVVFVPGTPASTIASAEATAMRLGATIGFTYTAALRGFSAKAPQSALDQIRAIQGVSYIEADSPVSINTIQFGPPLGLDRTSERLLSLDGRYTYSSNGTGVHAYVIDTGIRTTHVEFGGRASGAFTSIMDSFGTNDCNGHGTHVAGTIGGATFGIAKNVNLHAVRVLDCTGSGTLSGVIAGINWVTANAVHPAVANMSLGGGLSPTLNAAVASSVASGVTYAVAAGNSNADACGFSPASEPSAITVGSVNPTNDTRSSFSNFGTCLDLFGPGENIVSSWFASDTATATLSGTSMATPHVTGVAALYLQTHTAASPATVWAAIHYADDVSTTLGWGGVIGAGPGSPDELLHWGSRNDGHDDGDPHLTTVDGIHRDFQSDGELTLLRDGNGLEIQTRQSAVPSAPAVTDGYSGLTSCVSLNTAVAARVGSHRISYEPNLSGVPDPTGLQLRIDGVLTTLGASPLALSGGGQIANYPTGGIVVDFPDGTTMNVTPNWWPSQSKWYLNVSVFHTTGSEGVNGALAPGSWLPALPGGSSMGAMPGTLHQRYVDLYTTFANAWRVTAANSLFDYAPGTSTATFTHTSWPPESPPCVLKDNQDPPVQPLDPGTAQQLCRIVTDKVRNQNCINDVMVTGEAGFATIHHISEQIVTGSTQILLDDGQPLTAPQTPATFAATVMRNASDGSGVIPSGTVQFSVDGKPASPPIALDQNGHALWKTAALSAGEHQVSASYTAQEGSVFLPSTSAPVIHAVR
ncbi:MAG TPA: S8 family serine peptidase [Kofleriaceae bacterium]|jgi:subtilisin family serine protease|nr:S8 family serine peptidase [Kofleriaceae bacterium]